LNLLHDGRPEPPTADRPCSPVSTHSPPARRPGPTFTATTSCGVEGFWSHTKSTWTSVRNQLEDGKGDGRRCVSRRSHVLLARRILPLRACTLSLCFSPRVLPCSPHAAAPHARFSAFSANRIQIGKTQLYLIRKFCNTSYFFSAALSETTTVLPVSRSLLILHDLLTFSRTKKQEADQAQILLPL